MVFLCCYLSQKTVPGEAVTSCAGRQNYPCCVALLEGQFARASSLILVFHSSFYSTSKGTSICDAASSRNFPALPAAGTQAACSACNAPAPGMQLDVESRPSPILRHCFSSETVNCESKLLVHAVCLNKKACSQQVFVPICP